MRWMALLALVAALAAIGWVWLETGEVRLHVFIATALGVTADGVKSLLRRTRTALRDCIERRLNSSQHQVR